MAIEIINMGLGKNIWIKGGAGSYNNMVLFDSQLMVDDNPKAQPKQWLESIINRGANPSVVWELKDVEIKEGKVILKLIDMLPGSNAKTVELRTLTEKDFKKHVLPTIDGFEKPKNIQQLREMIFV